MLRSFVRTSSGASTIAITKRLLSMKSWKMPFIGLYGVCEDRNGSFLRGPAKAPAIIREHFKSDAYNGHTEFGFNVRGNNTIKDYGDFKFGDDFSSEGIYQGINKVVKQICTDNLVPFGLGGDHSISFPLIRSLFEARNFKPFHLLHFDAHPDIYDNFESNPSSHASPFARIMESNPRPIIKLLQVGVRCATPHQRQQMIRFGSSTIDSKDFPLKGSDLGKVFDTYFGVHSANSIQDIYLSIDVDVLDPAFAPGVSHRESGGISVRQLLDAVYAVNQRIIGVDLVEYNPDNDVQGVTGAMTSRIMQEVMGKVIMSHGYSP